MYGNQLDEAAKIVAAKREENLKFEHARLTADEKDDLLKKFSYAGFRTPYFSSYGAEICTCVVTHLVFT